MAKSLKEIQKLVARKRADEAIEAINERLNSNKFKKSELGGKTRGELADLYYYLGKSYSSKKDYDTALEKFDLALKHNSSHAAAMTEKGFAYYSDEENEKAIACFDKVINSINPIFAAAYTAKAAILKLAGKDEQSEEVFSNYLKNKEKLEIDSDSELREAFIHNLKGDLASSIDASGKAIKLNEDKIDIYWNLSFYYKDSKDYLKSIEALKKVLKLNSNFAFTIFDKIANAYFNLAEEAHDSGNPKEAEKLYDKSVEYCPYQTASYINKGWSLYNRAVESKWASKSSKQEKIEKALDEFGKAEDFCEEETLAIAGKIMCYRYLEDKHNEAKEFDKLDKSLGNEPDEELMQSEDNHQGLLQIKEDIEYKNLNLLRYQTGNATNADDWFDAYVNRQEQNNFDQQLHYLYRAEIIKKQQQIESDIKLDNIYSSIAGIYECNDKPADATKYARKALAYNKNNADNLHTIGNVLIKISMKNNDNYDETAKEGIGYLEKAIDIEDHSLTRTCLSEAYYHLGNTHKAIENIQVAQDIFEYDLTHKKVFTEGNIKYIKLKLEEFAEYLGDDSDSEEEYESDNEGEGYEEKSQNQLGSAKSAEKMLKQKINEFRQEIKEEIATDLREEIKDNVETAGKQYYVTKQNIDEVRELINIVENNDILTKYFEALSATIFRAFNDENSKISNTIQTSGNVNLQGVTDHIPVPIIGEVIRTAGFAVQKGINTYDVKHAKNVAKTIDATIAPQLIRTVALKVAANKEPLDLQTGESSEFKQFWQKIYDKCKDKIAGNMHNSTAEKKAAEDGMKLIELCRQKKLDLSEDSDNLDLIEVMSDAITDSEIKLTADSEPVYESGGSGSEPDSYESSQYNGTHLDGEFAYTAGETGVDFESSE
jgi:tetratricopeptide (TPR) repeat protein